MIKYKAGYLKTILRNSRRQQQQQGKKNTKKEPDEHGRKVWRREIVDAPLALVMRCETIVSRCSQQPRSNTDPHDLPQQQQRSPTYKFKQCQELLLYVDTNDQSKHYLATPVTRFRRRLRTRAVRRGRRKVLAARHIYERSSMALVSRESVRVRGPCYMVRLTSPTSCCSIPWR